MPTPKLLSCVVLVLAFCATAANADRRNSEETRTVELEGATRLEVNVDFGLGKLTLSAADLKDEAHLTIFCDPRYVDYDVDYHKRGETGLLDIESDVHNHGRRHHDDDNIDNECDLELPNNLPLSLHLNLGLCEGDLDLGGLRITDLDLDIGASSGRIEFSRPNPERMRDMKLDVGAASLEINGLGNANAERISCEVGAGSCDLDFRDGVKGDCMLEIDVGLGSSEILVPRDMALRVRGEDEWFSSIDFSGLDLREVSRGVWESDDFDKAKDRLTIDADVAMGSIDIRGRR